MRELLGFFDLDPGTQAALGQAGRIVVILVIAWLLQRTAARLLAVFHFHLQRRHPEYGQLGRIGTVEQVVRYIATVVISVIAGSLVLGVLGISIFPILATAGVAGIAIGFGAQTLIKDYFNGLFLLIEDQLRQGELVDIAGYSGVVEELTLRHVKLRDEAGRVYFVPNSAITVVVNHSRKV